jgi:hypothetical protein
VIAGEPIMLSPVIAMPGAGLGAGTGSAFCGCVMRACDRFGAARAASEIDAVDENFVSISGINASFGQTMAD